MSLQATAALAADESFAGRVQAAMVTAAIGVAAEPVGSQTVAVYQARHDLAVMILQGTRPVSAGGVPPGVVPWLTQFVWAVAAKVAADGADIPDGDIQAAVVSVFGSIAGAGAVT